MEMPFSEIRKCGRRYGKREKGDQKFSFEQAKLEVFIKHPSMEIEETGVYVSLEIRGDAQAGDIKSGVDHIWMVFISFFSG